MTDIHRKLSLPLDNGFLRRQCPFCRREFKVSVPTEELQTLAQQAVEGFLLETMSSAGHTSSDENQPEAEFFCPYCGQQAASSDWWTDEQIAYFQVIAQNIAADLINENLIRPLKRTFRGQKTGLISMRFEGQELPRKQEWLAPDPPDMTEVYLACCERRIKVQDDWCDTVFCFFCGFPHNHLIPKDTP